MRPHGKESSWDPRDVGGTVMPTWRVGDWCCCGGTVYAHVMLLLWGATSCVGWEWWDRTMKIGSSWYKEIKSNGLGFYVEKPSPLDSVSTQRNRVHWTRFLCITLCQFRTLCLITPIPHSWLLPTAATSRGHKQSLHSSITPQPSTWHNRPPNITWVPADSFTWGIITTQLTEHESQLLY